MPMPDSSDHLGTTTGAGFELGIEMARGQVLKTLETLAWVRSGKATTDTRETGE